MEPLSVIATLPLVKPLLDSTADLARALKEPFGKKRIEEMRSEIASVLEENAKALEMLAKRVDSLEEHRKRVEEWAGLPWYRRLFAPFPR